MPPVAGRAYSLLEVRLLRGRQHPPYRAILGLMARAVPRPQTAAAPAPETISFDEAMVRHDGEWLLLRVISYDQRKRPSQVHVLARGPNQQSVCRALNDYHFQTSKPDMPYYILEAARHITTGEEMRRALAALPESDEPGAWGVWRRW